MDGCVTHRATDPTTWVDVYGDYLYRFAVARVRAPEAAEDLVQETLLAALEARAGFGGRASERSWLTAILKRKIMDWLRRQIRRRAKEERLPDESADGIFTRYGKWRVKPDDWSADDPGRDLMRAEFRQTFASCLNKLPGRLSQVFVWRHLGERSAAEMQAAAGVSAANLSVMLHRARLRLWKCLSVNWFGEDAPKGDEAC